MESNDEERSGRLRLEESLRREGGLERYAGEQQKVSLLYILQLKFSRRLPSCNVSAHFENTAIERVVSRLTERMKGSIRRTISQWSNAFETRSGRKVRLAAPHAFKGALT